MPRIVQQLRTATSNNPPVAGSLLPGQLSVEMGSPARLWVGVDAALDPTMQKLLIDTSNVGGAITEPVGAGTWGRLETGLWQRSVAVAGDTMTGALTISGPAAGTLTGLVFDGPANTSREMAFRTGGQDRWVFHSDAGNDFALLRFLGAASYDSVLYAEYATGAVQFGTALNPGSVKVSGPLTSLDLTIRNPVGSLLVLDRPAGQWAVAQGTTAGIVRWAMTLGDGSAETGANAGSNFGLFRYDDLGVALPNAITANRASGVVDFSVPPTVGGVPVATVGNFVLKTGDTMTGTLTTPALWAINPAGTWGVGEVSWGAGADYRYLLYTDASGNAYLSGTNGPATWFTYFTFAPSGGGVYCNPPLLSYGRITGHAGVAFNAGGDYVAYDDGTNRIFQFAGGYYEAYTIATGLRLWVGNNAGIMSLDWGGNLWVNQQVGANKIVSRTGIFEVMPNYYMGRNSLDGRWMFTENGTENFSINTAGRATARIATTFSVGRNMEAYCSGAYSALNWDWQYNLFWSNATAVMTHGSPLGSPWNCYNNGQTVQGGPCYATAYPGPSDAAMKTNIQPWAAGLAEILQISTVSYQWADGTHLGTPGKTYYGVTAQDVQVAIPEAVHTFEHQLGFMPPQTPEEAADWPDPEPVTMLAVESATIFYAAVNAIKELHALITAQAARITALEGAA
jgi:hypothetical protein